MVLMSAKNLTSAARSAKYGAALTAALLVALVAALWGGASQAWAVEEGLNTVDGQYQYYEQGKQVKSAWKDVNGARYYFNSKGNAVTGTSKKINGKYYIFGNDGKLLKPSKSKVYELNGGVFYVNKKGQPAGEGWCIVKDELYKVAASGKCVAGKKVDGITFLKNGRAKDDKSTELKVRVMTLVDQLTTPGMTKKQKLRKCFNYVLNSSKYANSQEPTDIGKKGWAQRAALKVLQRKKYDCFGFACVISAFAYELGYKPTIRGKALKHAFCLINGRGYDMVGPRFDATPLKVDGAKNWKYSGWDASGPAAKKAKGWTTKNGARYYYDSKGKAYTGSHKISGKYYVFDAKGKLLKDKVKNGKKTVDVKVSGVTYRVNNKGIAVPGWTDNKKTLYCANGAKATGLASNKGKLYWFNSKGVLDKAKTGKIQAAAKLNKDATQLVKLIGKPVSKKVEASCNPDFVQRYPNGKDVIMTFKNAKLEFFQLPNGTLYLTNIG